MKHTLLICTFLLLFSMADAQQIASANDTTPFYKMSLEELMNVTVTVASQLPMTNRESPGIITIITGEEIQKSGARDLMQVLQQVQGIDFGVDVEGVVGIGVRGNWAHEGKVLLLWDGMEMNEDLYSTLQFGSHYPVDQIKKIEIIRGPGCAMYGGNAEYAVINVITLNSSEFDGITTSVSNSYLGRSFGSEGVSIAAGKTLGKAHINLSTTYNSSIRSEDIYTDFAGKKYDMSKQSGITDCNYRFDFFLKGFSISALYDNYSLEQRDGYDEIYLRPYKIDFNTTHVSAKYEFHQGKKLVITPGLQLKYQQPWSYRRVISDDTFLPFNTTVDKNEYYLNASYDPNDHIDIICGGVYYNQLARQNFDSVIFNNGNNKFGIDNYAIYLQSIIKLSPLNIILGSRFDYNPFYGSSFVPRFGVTKVWSNIHVKALYSRAFRSPSVENINISPDILPEKTDVTEFEFGCKLLPNSYLTANIYDISTYDPIIFYYDENGKDEYKNEAKAGTRGFEIEYKWKYNGWYTALNYSYYSPAGHPVVNTYQIPGHTDQLLAFPSHKINLAGNIHLSKYLNINSSVNFLSKRYSYSMSELGTVTGKKFRPSLYFNLTLNLENIFNKNFLIQASVLNLFNEKVVFIQPYNGNHNPLPGTGREFQMKLTYSFSFKDTK